jgi:hypothetical protein
MEKGQKEANMANKDLDLQTLANRLENVEKDSRRIKVLGFLAIALGIFAGFLGGIISPYIMPGSKYIKAEMFELIDKKGQSRGAFSVDENNNAFFVLFDETGNNQRLSMVSLTDGRSFIELDDLTNHKAAVIETSEAHNGLALYNKGKASIGFLVEGDGVTNMSIYKDEQRKVFCGLNKDGDSELTLLGESGITAFDLTASKDGDRILKIRDKNGKARNGLSIINNQAILSLFDNDEKIRVLLKDDPQLWLLKDSRLIARVP